MIFLTDGEKVTACSFFAYFSNFLETFIIILALYLFSLLLNNCSARKFYEAID